MSQGDKRIEVPRRVRLMWMADVIAKLTPSEPYASSDT